MTFFRAWWGVSVVTPTLWRIMSWVSSLPSTRRMCLLPVEIASAVRRARSLKPEVVIRMPLVAPCGSRLPEKLLTSGFSDLAGPAFCLDVHAVEAEGVLVDDAVDASVSGASDVSGTSVAHVFEQVEDGVLEAAGWDVG